jgi:pyridoxal/pyridoxine/pyridoxamine kinase
MARILVECGNALVAMDRVEALHAAGHQVATCPGPNHNDCPVLSGRPCDAVADADVVVSSLGDKTLRVALATKIVHPDKQIVAILTGSEISEIVRVVDGVAVLPAGADDHTLVAAVQAALAEDASP